MTLALLLLLAQDFPKPKGYVVDTVGVLSSETQKRLTKAITELKQKTGAELAIVIVPTVQPLDIHDYAMELQKRWGGVGSKKEDSGLLIVVAVSDRKYRIEVGYGLEGTITDAQAGKIGREYFVPHFKQNDYDTGLLQTSYALMHRIAEEKGVVLTGVPAAERPRGGSNRCFGSFGGLIVMVILFSMLSRGRVGWWPLIFLGMGGGRWLGGGTSGSSFGGGSFGGGGFGGFGGGGFGGGGASGSW